MPRHERCKIVKHNFLKLVCQRCNRGKDESNSLPPTPTSADVHLTPSISSVGSTYNNPSLQGSKSTSPRLRNPSHFGDHPLPLSSHPTCGKLAMYQYRAFTDIEIDIKKQALKADNRRHGVQGGNTFDQSIDTAFEKERNQFSTEAAAPFPDEKTVAEYSDEEETGFISTIDDDTQKLINIIEQETR